MTETTPEMSIHDVVENLKTMELVKQSLERFSAKERETLNAAIYDLECLNAINLDLASENDELLDQISKIKETTWIPVTKRLPKAGTEVLCCNACGAYLLAVCIYKDGACNRGYIAENSECVMYDVVAWMPLPEPYKAESEGG